MLPNSARNNSQPISLLKTELSHLLALLISAIAIAIGFYPALQHFSTHYLGETTGDGGIYVWLSQHAFTAVVNNFTATYLFPHGQTLAWSDMFLAPAAVCQSIQWLTESHVQAYNATLLVGAVCNCFFTYVLARELKISFVASLIAGVTFALSDTFLAHAGHPQFYWSFFLPWSLAVLTRLSPNLSRLKLFINGIILGVLFCLSLITSAYTFIFMLTAFFFWVLRQLYALKAESFSLVPAAIGCVLAIVPAIPVCNAYLAIKNTYGPRGIYEAFDLSATPSGYFAALPEISWRSFSSGVGTPENFNLFGIGLLIVLIKAIFETKNKMAWLGLAVFILLGGLSSSYAENVFVKATNLNALTILKTLCVWLLFTGSFVLFCKKPWLSLSSAVCLGVIFICFSFGPLAPANDGSTAFSPFVFFRSIIPGFDGLRACSRFAIVACLCFAIAGSYLLSSKANLLKWIYLAATVALQTVSTLPLESALPAPAILQPFTQNVAVPGAVLILPLLGEKPGWGSYARQATRYMNWLSDYRYPIVNGYSGITSKLQKELFDAGSQGNMAKQVQYAQKIVGLQYLVTLGSLRLSDADLSTSSFKESICDESGCRYDRSDENLPDTIIIPPIKNATLISTNEAANEVIGGSLYPLQKVPTGFSLIPGQTIASPRRIRFSQGITPTTLFISVSPNDQEKAPWLCALPMFYCVE